GRVAAPQLPGQYNTITFEGIPLDPPGPGVSRTFRITNVRINVASLGISQGFWTQATSAVVAVTGNTPVAIEGAQQIIGYVQPSINSTVTGTGEAGSKVHVVEGFASAWRT